MGRQLMNITFTADCPPCLHSGWSAYKAGDKATLRHGKHLIDAGFARVGWEPVKFDEEILERFDTTQLRKRAKELGVRGYSKMKRETLIKKLEGRT